MSLAIFSDIIFASFNIGELRDLCWRIGVDHESIPQTTKDEFVRELVQYCARRQRLSVLCGECRKLRPLVDWPCSFLTFMASAPPGEEQQPIDTSSYSPNDISKGEHLESELETTNSSKSGQPALVDVGELARFLVEKQWRLADEETTRVLLASRKRKRRDLNLLNPKDISNAVTLLQGIDDLWRRHSEDRFGFGTQRSILEAISGETHKYATDDLIEFCDAVAWPLSRLRMKSYDHFRFDEHAPPGHLPTLHLREHEQADGFIAWKDIFISVMNLFGIL